MAETALPEPGDRFVALTDAVSRRFDALPYEGLHETVTPHLTVAIADDPALLTASSGRSWRTSR